MCWLHTPQRFEAAYTRLVCRWGGRFWLVWFALGLVAIHTWIPHCFVPTNGMHLRTAVFLSFSRSTLLFPAYRWPCAHSRLRNGQTQTTHENAIFFAYLPCSVDQKAMRFFGTKVKTEATTTLFVRAEHVFSQRSINSVRLSYVLRMRNRWAQKYASARYLIPFSHRPCRRAHAARE